MEAGRTHIPTLHTPRPGSEPSFGPREHRWSRVTGHARGYRTKGLHSAPSPGITAGLLGRLMHAAAPEANISPHSALFLPTPPFPHLPVLVPLPLPTPLQQDIANVQEACHHQNPENSSWRETGCARASPAQRSAFPGVLTARIFSCPLEEPSLLGSIFWERDSQGLSWAVAWVALFKNVQK